MGVLGGYIRIYVENVGKVGMEETALIRCSFFPLGSLEINISSYIYIYNIFLLYSISSDKTINGLRVCK